MDTIYKTRRVDCPGGCPKRPKHRHSPQHVDTNVSFYCRSKMLIRSRVRSFPEKVNPSEFFEFFQNFIPESVLKYQFFTIFFYFNLFIYF